MKHNGVVVTIGVVVTTGVGAVAAAFAAAVAAISAHTAMNAELSKGAFRLILYLTRTIFQSFFSKMYVITHALSFFSFLTPLSKKGDSSSIIKKDI